MYDYITANYRVLYFLKLSAVGQRSFSSIPWAAAATTHRRPQVARSADVKNIINWLTIVIVGVNRGNENVRTAQRVFPKECLLLACVLAVFNRLWPFFLVA